jgi:transposase
VRRIAPRLTDPKAPIQMSYLGLTPSENSSGERRRLDGITKAGDAKAWMRKVHREKIRMLFVGSTSAAE